MNENCFDIGIIQAFLDGELSHDETSRVSAHIAHCDPCAFMLAEAEEESAIVFPALEREFNTLVPTQRLWSKINESIKTEQENRPVWEKALAFLRLSFSNPSMLAAASLLLVFGLFGVLWINKASVDVATTPTVTNRPSAPTAAAPSAAPSAVTASAPSAEPTVETASAQPASPRIERAVYRPEVRRETASYSPDSSAVTLSRTVPGEESYVRTISTLKKTVDGQKDDVLRPSERIAFERDMAFVNDTIDKMRTEVKRNPKNEAAKQVLYSSYQNKIDLLNSVAQKEELVASLK